MATILNIIKTKTVPQHVTPYSHEGAWGKGLGHSRHTSSPGASTAKKKGFVGSAQRRQEYMNVRRKTMQGTAHPWGDWKMANKWLDSCTYVGCYEVQISIIDGIAIMKSKKIWS